MPLELDELLDELDELEDELLELDELELLELEVLAELEELVELEELELLLEPVLSPSQPPNQILLATSASDRTRLCVIDLFMTVNHSVIDVLGADLLSNCLREHRGNQAPGERSITEVRHRPST